MCKADLDEVVITKDKTLTWQHFEKKVMKHCKDDPEDECIYYHDDECLEAGMELRNLTCMFKNCKSN